MTKNKNEILQYDNDKYIILSKFIATSYGKWQIAKKPFSNANVYQAVNKKDEHILKEYLKDENIEIEWFISHNSHPYIWDDFCLDFIKDYDEDYQYRLKNMQ